jgi:two-component system LytT family response regulator
MALRVLIVDDEPLARQRIADMLAHESDVEIVGEVGDGNAAVEKIRQLQPDLVFLDVQMPGKSGLDVVRTIGAREMPATIFVTAFDAYALQAFDVAAIDYLVKPFDDDRFEQAFARARQVIELKEVAALRQKLLAVLQHTPAQPAPRPDERRPKYLDRIAVEMRGKVKVVPVDQVDYITADGPYAELHAGERTHVIRETMQSLEQQLDPDRFLRIHRSAIVAVSRIEALLKGAGGDYEVQLRGGVLLPVSRARREEVERRIGVRAHD